MKTLDPDLIALLGRSPSDLLAATAGALLEASRRPQFRGPLHSAFALIEEEEDGLDPPNDWLLPAATLCMKALFDFGDLSQGPPLDPPRLATWLLTVQRLDRWHAPLLPHNSELMRLAGHYEAEDRLFGEEGCFNVNPALGLVIPGRTAAFAYDDALEDEDDEPADPAEPRSILLELLDNVAYLPPEVEAEDPDFLPGKTRKIGLRYQRSLGRHRSIPAGTASIEVAIAPLAEGPDDLQVSTVQNGYGIRPVYPPPRLEQVVRHALDLEAHILCLPEMSVDHDQLGLLREALVPARRDYAERTGKAPRLRYVLCGVIATATSKGSKHRNYIHVMDSEGRMIAEQAKLSHWNMTPGQQARFGFAKHLGIVPPSPGNGILHEHTIPGDSINILDLDGMGRLLTLICADMSQDQPGDWLLENFRVDWLYAPIMDGSTCWTQKDAPWIIGRAAQAARTGRSRVLVTNSITMTHWNNRVIEAHQGEKDYDFVPYSGCGIGLLLDPRKPALGFQHVVVPLSGTTSPVVEHRSWLRGWSDLTDDPPGP